MPILFNQIPGSGLVAPMFAFEVNSAGGYGSPARLLLIGHKTSSGSLAANTPTVIGSQSDADSLCGGGSMLREMYRIARQNAPVQEIWAMHVAEPAGAAQVSTITVGAGAAGTAGFGAIDICGERLLIPISSADTVTTIAAAIVTAINGYFNALTGAMLPVTATSSVGVVTVTARHLGVVLADIDYYVPTELTGNIFAPSGRITVASTTAGTGTPTLSTALAALGDDPYDVIVSPWGDATSIGAYTTSLNDTSGRWAYSRQSYGHVITVSTGSLSALTTLGLSLNDRHVTVLGRLAASPHPAWLWAAAFAARAMPWLSDYTTGNVSRNQTGLVVQGLIPPRDRTTWLQYAARNTAAGSGISTWIVNQDGTVAIDKLVTTYRTGVSGQADTVFRDIQSMLQLTSILRYMRTQLANQHGTKAIADSNPGNLGALVTVRDIKATLVMAYDQLAAWGVVENGVGFAANVQVQRNSGQPNRVDVFMPIQRVKPLDVLAGNATLYASQLPGS